MKIVPRPSTRPYAEFRFRDIEGNALDLSQTKGWEVDVDKWETRGVEESMVMEWNWSHASDG